MTTIEDIIALEQRNAQAWVGLEQEASARGWGSHLSQIADAVGHDLGPVVARVTARVYHQIAGFSTRDLFGKEQETRQRLRPDAPDALNLVDAVLSHYVTLNVPRENTEHCTCGSLSATEVNQGLVGLGLSFVSSRTEVISRNCRLCE